MQNVSAVTLKPQNSVSVTGVYLTLVTALRGFLKNYVLRSTSVLKCTFFRHMMASSLVDNFQFLSETCCLHVQVNLKSLLLFAVPYSYPEVYGRSFFLTNQQINEILPRRRDLFEKPKSPQLIKKFPIFYGTRSFITAFTSARHLPLS